MKRIYLVRHGLSEGNEDRNVHRKIADHAIKLNPLGESQATMAGDFLEGYLRDNNIRPRWYKDPVGFLKNSPNKFRVWRSPYDRTRMTADRLISQLDPKRIIDVREHAFLVEQQFGLFDGLDNDECAALFPEENDHYLKQKNHGGRFWAQQPLGESRFMVAQRVHSAFGTFHRDCDKHGIENIIVVSHGTTLRCFAMMWLHLPYEWMEQEPNPKNCSIRLIEDNTDKGYIFEGF